MFVAQTDLDTAWHELRNPLTAIVGYAECLGDELAGPLTERQREFLNEIRSSAQRLGRLIEDLRGGLGGGDVGGFSIGGPASPERGDLATVVAAIAKSLQPQAAKAGVYLHLEGAACPIPVDTDRIGQVLSNLLINAIRHSSPGQAVTVRVGTDGAVARVEVADAGPGIAQRDQASLFQPYRQVGTNAGAAGLGLAICKALVEAQGGTLGVESEKGHGATFWFTLPLAG